MGYLINEFLDLKEKFYEWKKKREVDMCSDCGFFVACKKCSDRYSAVDKQLRKSEGRNELSDHFFIR